MSNKIKNGCIVMPQEAVEPLKLILNMISKGEIYICESSELEVKPDSITEKKSGWTVQGRKGSGGRVNLKNYGVNVGDTLVFLPTGVKVKVYDNNNVIDNDGTPISLSGYAREHMPKRLRKLHKDDTWDGLKYFAVNGSDVPLAEARNKIVQAFCEP